jgi:hypothetical protein
MFCNDLQNLCKVGIWLRKLENCKCNDFFCLSCRYDFFLVSQSVRQGTVSPTSYNVISDNLGLGPDKLQRLTYKLTHLYFNWSVSIALSLAAKDI